jgi:hypothetical protein
MPGKYLHALLFRYVTAEPKHVWRESSRRFFGFVRKQVTNRRKSSNVMLSNSSLMKARNRSTFLCAFTNITALVYSVDLHCTSFALFSPRQALLLHSLQSQFFCVTASKISSFASLSPRSILSVHSLQHQFFCFIPSNISTLSSLPSRSVLLLHSLQH